MGLFDSQTLSDAILNLDPDLMSGIEAGIYTPKGGTPRTIYVRIDRNPPKRFTEDGTDVTPVIAIEAANDETYGISSATLNAYGNDTFTTPARLGGTAFAFGIYIPEDGAEWQSAGMLRLDLK
jgi:hypothetical protein